jgi:hypothetical protein
MTDVELINKLCLKFCPYYKPSKDEELACMAYIVLERLMEKGDKIPFEKPGKAVATSTVETLAENLCVVCPFHENDCDFAERKENALPCGGFTLLGHLIEEKIILIDDIMNAVNTCE